MALMPWSHPKHNHYHQAPLPSLCILVNRCRRWPLLPSATNGSFSYPTSNIVLHERSRSCNAHLSFFFFTIGVRQLLLSTVFPPALVPLSPLPAGEYSRRCFTVSIGLPSVDGAGVLRPSPKKCYEVLFNGQSWFLS